MGNHQLAIKDFDLAIALDQDMAEGFYRRGLSKLRSLNSSGGIADLEKAQEKEVNSTPVHVEVVVKDPANNVIPV